MEPPRQPLDSKAEWHEDLDEPPTLPQRGWSGKAIKGSFLSIFAVQVAAAKECHNKLDTLINLMRDQGYEVDGNGMK